MTKKTNNEVYYDLKKKNGNLAMFLSFLVTGLGQIYAEKYFKGICFFVLSIILWVFLMGWIVWIISIVTAQGDVEEYNNKLKLELDL